MSPLVALLALACAAPLAVQAQTKCRAMSRGVPSHDLIDLSSIDVQLQDVYVQLEIVDKCALAHKELVGVLVTACDDQKPYLDVMLEWPYTPINVRRTSTSNATSSATVYITEYCKK